MTWFAHFVVCQPQSVKGATGVITKDFRVNACYIRSNGIWYKAITTMVITDQAARRPRIMCSIYGRRFATPPFVWGRRESGIDQAIAGLAA